MADDALRLQFTGVAHPEDLRKVVDNPRLFRATEAADHSVRPMVGKVISLIEERTFMRECIRIGLEQSSGARVLAFSSVGEYQQDERSVAFKHYCASLLRDG